MVIFCLIFSADEEQGNGIATVSPMLDTSSANNNPLPRANEDTSPSGEYTFRLLNIIDYYTE